MTLIEQVVKQMNQKQFENPKIRHVLNQPFLQHLLDNKKWTISSNITDKKTGTVKKNKKPLDMVELIQTMNTPNPVIRGAKNHTSECLVDANQIMDSIPNCSNIAMYLETEYDNIIVLDIEPRCDTETRERLMGIPGCLYAELSTSGKGVHMFFEKPKNFNDFENFVTSKTKLQNKLSDWEFLMNHFVTFTGDQIHLQPNENGETLEDVFADIASKQIKTEKTEIEISNDIPLTDIPEGEFLHEELVDTSFIKTPDDYGNDMSKYEYAYLGMLHRTLLNLLKTAYIQVNNHKYTDDEIVSIIHSVAVEKLEHRSKHDEYRQGMPYLKTSICNIIASSNKNKKK